ncbi:MAG: 30S ribosomal protein S6e [Candidatus Bathyarchaeota archaeon]|nr:MAG: 30S ribosomal protein S6e [Candidatus Bathyarchaeota archaeon]
MAKFKIILSDPGTGTSQMLDLEGPRAEPLIGRKLGESIDGTAIGLGGHKLKITGGSDKDGFPMRPDIHGGVKAKVVITNSTGFHSSNKGERRRKTVRGNVITDEIVQVNMKIIEKPKKSARAATTKPDTKTKDTDEEKLKE